MFRIKVCSFIFFITALSFASAEELQVKQPDKLTIEETKKKEPEVKTEIKAEEKQPEKKEPAPVSQKKKNEAKDSYASTPKMFLSFTGGFGISYPLGEFTGYGDQKPAADISYAFDLTYGYYLRDNGAITGGFSYAEKNVAVDSSFSGSPMKTTYTFHSLKINAGYRGFFNFFFLEAGLFYSFKAGDQKEKIEISGKSATTNSISSSTRDEAGIYLAFGAKYQYSPRLSFDAGIKLDFSFLNAYEKEHKFTTNSAMVIAGATWYFLK